MAKISVALIKPPTWNSRVTDAEKDKSERAEVESLAQTLKSNGQLQPIKVEGPTDDGGYILVFGTRRLAAAKLLGWQEIDATIAPVSTDGQRMAENGIENLKRKSLSTFEEARVFSELRKVGLKNEDIGARFGISPQKVSTAASRFERLPKPILDEWRAGNPVASDENLGDIHSDKKYPTPEKKMERWDELVREADEAEKTTGKQKGKRGKGKGGGGGLPVSQARLKHLVDVLSTKKGSPDLSDDIRNYCRALVSYIIQGREKPPTGIPDMPAKSEKPAKADKAA